ncbi:MAG: hypothetical protein R2788_24640 [Saprospiraceae bacterium]
MNKVRCEYEGEPDVLINVYLPDLSAGDFEKTKELIREGGWLRKAWPRS